MSKWRSGSTARCEFGARSCSDFADISNALGEPTNMVSGTETRRMHNCSAQRYPVKARTPIGLLLYLVSIGVIATAIGGVFFGTGLFLLRQPEMTSVAARGQGFDTERLVHLSVTPFAQPSAAERSAPLGYTLPSLSSDPPMSSPQNRQFGKLSLDLEANEAPTTVLAPSAPAAEASRLVSATAVPALSGTRPAELLARGDALFRYGDIASARLFYERAAEAGDRQAAMRMATTFDPVSLVRAGVRNTFGDPAQASFWYDRALGLSSSKAGLDTNDVARNSGGWIAGDARTPAQRLMGDR